MKTFSETEQTTETEGDHTENLKKLDVAAIENPELVAATQDKLDDVFGTPEEKEETAVPEKEPEGSTPEPEDGSKPEGDGQAEPEEKPDGSTPKAEKEDGKVDIPESYMRAAIHHGLDKKTVDELVEKDPGLAMKMLESCYLSVNNASREWSMLGRAKIEAERAQVEEPVTATEAIAQQDPATTALIANLKKEYPDDPLIETVIVGLKKPVQQPKPQVSQGQQGYETATRRANAAANVSTDQSINTFFSADTMKPYEKFYGKLELGQIPEDLSNGQQHNRLAVLEETECIIAGHSMRGQEIKLEQAMEKAHFIVTEHIREQVIREGLKTTTLKRKKSMTLKPSDSKRSSDNMRTDSSKPRNRRELEQSVQVNLDRVFKK